VLQANAGAPLETLMQECHTALRPTRGAVLSLAAFDAAAATMTWLGVGNVEGALLRARPGATPPRERINLRGGVVGDRLPPLRSQMLPIAAGDTLIFATDGISGGFEVLPPPAHPAGEVAADLLRRYAKASDDALVLVARFLGAAP